MTEDRGLAPRCASCRGLHDPALRCWRGKHATETRARVLRLKGTVCHICGEPDADTVDHDVPRSRWGTDSIENLLPAHRSCNSRRGTKANPHQPDPEPRPAGVGLSPRWRNL